MKKVVMFESTGIVLFTKGTEGVIDISYNCDNNSLEVHFQDWSVIYSGIPFKLFNSSK